MVSVCGGLVVLMTLIICFLFAISSLRIQFATRQLFGKSEQLNFHLSQITLSISAHWYIGMKACIGVISFSQSIPLYG